MKKSIDISKVVKLEHENKWVALSKDYKKLVSFDDNLLNLKRKVGETDVVYMKVPPGDAYLTF